MPVERVSARDPACADCAQTAPALSARTRRARGQHRRAAPRCAARARRTRVDEAAVTVNRLHRVLACGIAVSFVLGPADARADAPPKKLLDYHAYSAWRQIRDVTLSRDGRLSRTR